MHVPVNHYFRKNKMRTLTIEIKDKPVPLQRPRFSHDHVWDSQKHAKLVIGLQMTNQLKSQPLFTGPLYVSFCFIFAIPPKLSKIIKKQSLNKPVTSKPDTDNLIKMYLDCASKGVLFQDDACVCMISARKIYGDVPKTIMIITELEWDPYENKIKNNTAQCCQYCESVMR